MKEIDRITYKTVTQAELGLSQRSNQTHIGLSENYIDSWKKVQEIPTTLKIYFSKNNSAEIETILFNDPIIDPVNGARSPKFRSGYEREKPSLRDAILYYYRLNMRGEKTPLLIITSLKNNKKLEAFLISVDHDFYNYFMQNLSNKLVQRNNRNEIYSTLISSQNSDFEKIKNKLYSKSELNYFDSYETHTKNELDAGDKKTTTKVRKKQHEFRIKVLSAYKFKCCITDCDLPEAIEANHIVPYNQDDKDNHDITNGIPMRADLHKLWTRNKLGIDDNYRVRLHPDVLNSEYYKKYNRKKILLPINDNFKPNKKSLLDHCTVNDLI